MSASPTDTAPGARLRDFPVSFLSTVMGLSGLTIATEKLEAVLGLVRPVAGLVLFGLTLALFVTLAAIYVRKIIGHPQAVLAEWHHPVRISFFPAISISLILLAIAGRGIAPQLAFWFWSLGTALHLGLTLLVVTAWINHSRYEVVHINPAWFIPAVGNILVPIAGIYFAPADVSWFFFAVGLMFWVILLTIVMYRLFFHNPLPARMVPTLVILLAPPAVGFLSYLALTGGVIDVFARLLYFWAVFFFLLMLMQLPKFFRQSFALTWWAYSFPLGAFTIATLVMGERSGTQAYVWVGIGLFALLAMVVGGLMARTILAVRRREICLPEH